MMSYGQNTANKGSNTAFRCSVWCIVLGIITFVLSIVALVYASNYKKSDNQVLVAVGEALNTVGIQLMVIAILKTSTGTIYVTTRNKGSLPLKGSNRIVFIVCNVICSILYLAFAIGGIRSIAAFSVLNLPLTIPILETIYAFIEFILHCVLEVAERTDRKKMLAANSGTQQPPVVYPTVVTSY